MKPLRLLLLAASFLSVGANAQDSIKVTKTLNYRQTVTPQGMDKYFYFSGRNAYILKGHSIFTAPGDIVSMKLSPAGAESAVLSTKKENRYLKIYDISDEETVYYSFHKQLDPRAVCYSADAKQLFVVDGAGNLHFYVTSNYLPSAPIFNLGFVPSLFITSSNGYYIAAVNNDEVVIYNLIDHSVRTRIKTGGAVDAVAFSHDASNIGVLADGKLCIYNTVDFSLEHTLDNLVNAKSFAFHPEDKYVGVVQDENRIVFYNIFNPAEQSEIVETLGSVTCMDFGKIRNGCYVSYIAENVVCYKMLTGFKPYYSREMRKKLNERMMEWCKRGEDESEDDYAQRVNEQTRKTQKRIFANEISTSLAGDIISHTNISLGRYNTVNQSLELKLDNMQSVYIDVPQNELPDFADASNIEFCDVQYGITKNDSFEVIFAKVRNKATGKEYVFDNLEQQSLDFLATDDNFVSLELIQQANREDIVLQRIKKDVVEEAKNKQLISDHTNINVNTRVVSDVNAAGERINNYCVEFDYSVEAQYSAREDFAPGKYRIEESNAAKSTLDIITKAFSGDFAQYIVPGKKLVVSITGSADAIPIVGTIAYDGRYGEFTKEPYWLDANLSNITVTKASGIRTNEQLAFMRAQAVGAYLKANMTSLSAMQVEPRYNIVVADGKGGEYRRIKVSFVFVDAMR